MKIPTAYKISLFIAAILLCLALLSLLWEHTDSPTIGDTQLQWPAIGEVLGTPTPSRSLHESSDTLDWSDTASIVTPSVEDSVAQVTPAVSPKASAPAGSKAVAHPITITKDTLPLSPDTLHLTHLAEALAHADSIPVRVIYYGDSQIEGDRMTMIVRRTLQQRYGGGGVGLLPLHQTIASRTITQRLEMSGESQSSSGGPQRYLAYGPKSARRDTNLYGPMAQVAVMDSTLVEGSNHIVWRAEAPKKKQSDSYFNRIRIIATDSVTVHVDGGKRLSHNLFLVPDSSTMATVRLDGQGDVYGISLETDHGVMADNIPMRGCAGTIFTSINSRELKAYYAATNTRLIILQYGGNVVPYTHENKQVTSYIYRVRQQIRFLQRCAPDADIVFVGPSDMVDKESGEITTHPAVDAIDKGLARMCKEENVLYFSLFHAMGGAGSMKHWNANGWAGSDLIHFTRQGADKAGTLLADWIISNM